MKRLGLACLIVLFLALVVGDRNGWLRGQETAPDGWRTTRLFDLPPNAISLSTPVWSFQNHLEPEWRKTPFASGWIRYEWNGYLDVDVETPGVDVWSGPEKISFQSSLPAQPAASAYAVVLGKPFFTAGPISLPADADDALRFEILIPSASPVLAFVARRETDAIPNLTVSLGDQFAASIPIDSPQWKLYSLPAAGVLTGTQTLSIDGSRADVPLFVVKELRIANRTQVSVDLPGRSPAPVLRYRPSDPVRNLLESPPTELRPASSAPWTVYDEDESLVREVDIDGTVRTGLFLPTPSQSSAEIEDRPGQRFHFHSTLSDPYHPDRSGNATLRVYVATEKNPKPSLRLEQILSHPPAPDAPTWTEGQTIDLPVGEGKITVLIETASARDEPFAQAVFLGDPVVFTQPTQPVAAGSPPNVILISLDTLRADALSCYGNPRETSPFIDRFFGTEGARFLHAEAPCTWTLPSHASLFLSQYVSRHGVVGESVKIPPSVSMLAERFSKAGYETAAFVDKGFVDAKYGFAQGFHLYDQQAGHFASILPRVETWLTERESHSPLFLFLHSFDIHAPYDEPEPFHSQFVTADMVKPEDSNIRVPSPPALQSANRTSESGAPAPYGEFAEYWRALYDGGVRYVDDQLERFFSRLESQPEFNNSIIILFSDHGESFYEHGSWAHGWNVYQELTHVPVLIRFPGQEYAGVTVDERVSLLDIAPTLFDFLGWERPEDWQGRSLMPFVRGEKDESPRRVFSELNRDPFIFSAVYLKNRKYIEALEYNAQARSIENAGNELYDLAEDPGEKLNLAADRIDEASEELGRARKALDLMRALRESEGGSASVLLNAEDVEELIRQGYMK